MKSRARTTSDSIAWLSHQLRRVDALAQTLDDPTRAIFNLHVPPYDSGLDTAAELDVDLSVVMAGSEPKMIPVAFDRPLRDIDLIVRRRDARKVEAHIAARGWEPARQFNALNGARRLLFHEPEGDAQIDVFVEAFEMCHTLPLADGLGQPGPSLPATELLMTKLQIVKLNAKDRDECYALLRGSSIGSGDPAAVDPARIARLTAGDWGLHHTFELNLSRLMTKLETVSISDEGSRTIRAAIDAVTSAMEAEPKSRGWRLRARIGQRKIWYDEPEEVQR